MADIVFGSGISILGSISITPPPIAPGAPTIGTATATSDTTATVTFTAPASDGGATITTYTAISSPAGGTGTLNQAGSGTINVTGLTDNTSYTFTVTATNIAGTSSPSASSNSITTPTVLPIRQAIFGYGAGPSGWLSITNLVSTTGVVATDTAGVGTVRFGLAAAGYGGDKAIFGYGFGGEGAFLSLTNLVSNTGVVANDTSGVGTARVYLAAAAYGGDKALFGFGATAFGVSGSYQGMTNLVSNTGVVANNTAPMGLARDDLAAAGYGTDKAIFGFGGDNINVNYTNLVSNTGVVANDVLGIGTARRQLAAASYGIDKAIFGYGNTGTKNTPVMTSITNLVSNTGVLASDTTGVGFARNTLAAASYGTNKAIFGYGNGSVTNLVTNTGVVGNDVTGVGTGRGSLAATSFSS
jgi:hypothetical protein